MKCLKAAEHKLLMSCMQYTVISANTLTLQLQSDISRHLDHGGLRVVLQGIQILVQIIIGKIPLQIKRGKCSRRIRRFLAEAGLYYVVDGRTLVQKRLVSDIPFFFLTHTRLLTSDSICAILFLRWLTAAALMCSFCAISLLDSGRLPCFPAVHSIIFWSMGPTDA